MRSATNFVATCVAIGVMLLVLAPFAWYAGHPRHWWDQAIYAPAIICATVGAFLVLVAAILHAGRDR